MCRAAAQFAAHLFHLRVQAWAFMATRPRRRRNDKPQRTPNHNARQTTTHAKPQRTPNHKARQTTKQSRNDDERT
jgi:hypothetical protein